MTPEETLTLLNKLSEVMDKALESGDEIVFDSFFEIIEILTALHYAIDFIQHIIELTDPS